jgi:putative ABC transport system permease protein
MAAPNQRPHVRENLPLVIPTPGDLQWWGQTLPSPNPHDIILRQSVAYLTGHRVPEFGVRMALGAHARDVMGLVLRQSLGMIFVGVLLGAAGAWAAGRLLVHTVDGVRPAGAVTFAVTIPVLVVAALLASFVPARRASRVDPVEALRRE